MPRNLGLVDYCDLAKSSIEMVLLPLAAAIAGLRKGVWLRREARWRNIGVAWLFSPVAGLPGNPRVPVPDR